MATSRLGLPTPSGSDLIAGGDDAITALADVLDNAAIFASGTFSSRPAASALGGKFYLATDVGIVYLSDGTNWLEVSRGGGSVPIGGMLEYAGSGDPADTRFILADGRAISRSTYAAAFAILGTTHGAGDGSTTFNVPDARGRGSVAPDDMGTAKGAASRMASNNTLGAVGGQETRALSSANLASHTHDAGTLATDTAAAHSHAAGSLVTSSNSAGTPAGTINAETTDHTHTGTTGVDGSDHTHSGSTGGRTAAHVHTGSVTAEISGGAGPTDQAVNLINATHITSSVIGGVTTGTESSDHGHAFTTGGRSANHQHSYMTSGRSAAHTHTLTGTAMTAHSHTVTGTSDTGGSHGHAVAGTTTATGSGTAFNQMGPYVVLNKIIRIL